MFGVLHIRSPFIYGGSSKSSVMNCIHTQEQCMLLDFEHKYSSFYHTCLCEISKESSKYQYSYLQLKLFQSYTLGYI